MKARLHAARVICKRQCFAVLISPGYYLSLSMGMILSYLVIRGFIHSIDSNGFNPELSSSFDLIARSFTGLFGSALFRRIFSQGPFLLSGIAGFLPITVFITMNMVGRLGFEKNVGAVDLVLFGPADGFSYVIASMVRDIFLYMGAFFILILYSAFIAVTHNLVLGPDFFLALTASLFFGIVFSAYTCLCAVVTNSTTSGVVLCILIAFVFMLIQTGTYLISGQYVHTLSLVFSLALRWVSPVYYSGLILNAQSNPAAVTVLAVIGNIGIAGTAVFLGGLYFNKTGERT